MKYHRLTGGIQNIPYFNHVLSKWPYKDYTFTAVHTFSTLHTIRFVRRHGHSILYNLGDMDGNALIMNTRNTFI